MKKYFITQLIILLSFVFSISTKAHLSNSMTVMGLVESFDQSNIKIKSLNGDIWEVDRAAVQAKVKMRFGDKISITAFPQNFRKLKKGSP